MVTYDLGRATDEAALKGILPFSDAGGLIACLGDLHFAVAVSTDKWIPFSEER